MYFKICNYQPWNVTTPGLIVIFLQFYLKLNITYLYDNIFKNNIFFNI